MKKKDSSLCFLKKKSLIMCKSYEVFFMSSQTPWGLPQPHADTPDRRSKTSPRFGSLDNIYVSFPTILAHFSPVLNGKPLFV